MPILQNHRHEAFAQARVAGARLDDAYEDAGFMPGRGHASRLAHTPEVAERIAELRADKARLADAGAQAVILSLLRIAKASEDLGTPAGIKEARLTLLEARRMTCELASWRARERVLEFHYEENLVKLYREAEEEEEEEEDLKSPTREEAAGLPVIIPADAKTCQNPARGRPDGFQDHAEPPHAS